MQIDFIIKGTLVAALKKLFFHLGIFILLLDLLIELLDAVLTILLFTFICAKVSFPLSFVLI